MPAMAQIQKMLQLSHTTIFCGLLAVSMSLVNTTAISQTNDLPELGNSAGQYLNPSQEEEIGKEFFRHLIGHKYFVDDYELQDYLQSVGDEVGASADLRGTPLTFHLIKDNSLNAFAVPGGYITFHTGLILTTDTESELASVVGHEIAHLTQRHLPRLVAQANQNKLPTIAAIIGSILIGGQAGLAGLTATTATIESNRLAYTRGFEKEADAIGIQLLAEANYDPTAMAGFFSKLERYTRHDNTEIPEFLRTHPLSYTRVSESEARASEYASQPHASSFEFHLAKAKIRALYTDRRDDPEIFFQTQIETGEGVIKDAGMFGMALSYRKSRQYEKAQSALKPLVEKYPNHPWIQSTMAQIEMADNHIADGIMRYESLIAANPAKVYLNYHLANALLTNKQPELAKKTIRYQIRRHPDLYIFYRLLSRANADLGSLAEAHQADAEYQAILGSYTAAIESLKLALRESGDEGYLATSINARKIELEDKLVLQKKINKG